MESVGDGEWRVWVSVGEGEWRVWVRGSVECV